MPRKRPNLDARQDALFELPPAPPSIEPDPCEAYHGGNPESEEAHASLSVEHKSEVRGRLLVEVGKRKKRGMTCDDLERVTKLRHQTVSARIVELLAAGDLVRTARRRQTRSGRMASVLVGKDHWGPEMGLGGRRKRNEGN